MFLPGELQGQGSLVGCRLWGRTESDTTEAAAAAVKDPPANAEDVRHADSIPGSGRYLGGGNGEKVFGLYSCQENLMDREAWQAMVHRVAKSRT